MEKIYHLSNVYDIELNVSTIENKNSEVCGKSRSWPTSLSSDLSGRAETVHVSPHVGRIQNVTVFRCVVMLNTSHSRIPSCTFFIKVDSYLSVPCQFRISDLSFPYQYRPFSTPDVCEWFYLKYMRRSFCVGHCMDGTDTELTRH
jgi:hypothetical protein